MICRRCGDEYTTHMKSEQATDVYLVDEHGHWNRINLCLSCDRELYGFLTNGESVPERKKHEHDGAIRGPRSFVRGMRLG